MYLSKEQTEQLATNIRRLLGEFAGGCWITPDFTFRAEARDLPPERVRLREAITGVTQRQVDASAFEDDHDLAAFLGRVGFNVQVRSQVDETPSFSSIQALGLSPASIERLRGGLTRMGHDNRAAGVSPGGRARNGAPRVKGRRPVMPFGAGPQSAAIPVAAEHRLQNLWPMVNLIRAWLQQ